MSEMKLERCVVGLGEALFDVLPSGPVLGGAPLNVAFHAHRLLQMVGSGGSVGSGESGGSGGSGGVGKGVVASRVGQDEMGDAVMAALDEAGMERSVMQTDPDRPTGRVFVGLDGEGQPSYEIVEEVAWDYLSFDPDLAELARECDAVCFGTLGQRHGEAHSTIARFLDEARQAIRLFDVNLRQDYYDRNVLRKSAEAATVIKLNREELPIVCEALGLVFSEGEDGEEARVKQICKGFGVTHAALTRGAAGTQWFTPEGVFEAEVPAFEREEQADSVGAGDACSAGLLVGMLLGKSAEQTVGLANRMGGWVASKRGATPELRGGGFGDLATW